MPRSQIKIKDALKDVQAYLDSIKDLPPPKEETVTKPEYDTTLKEWIVLPK